MIAAIVAFFALLFGGGSPEIFYVDNIDKGVKKFVVDKHIKKELKDTLKWTTKAIESFRKEQKSHIKALKKLNLDIQSTPELYIAFFEMQNKARLELSTDVVNMRSYAQSIIKPDEWKQIMDMAETSAKKDNDKEEKKAAKGSKDIFKGLNKKINEQVVDVDKKALILDALSVYEAAFNIGKKTMADNDVQNRDILSDQHATKTDMFAFHEALAEVRNDFYAAYTAFYFVVKENTSEEEFTPIIKEFNKTY